MTQSVIDGPTLSKISLLIDSTSAEKWIYHKPCRNILPISEDLVELILVLQLPSLNYSIHVRFCIAVPVLVVWCWNMVGLRYHYMHAFIRLQMLVQQHRYSTCRVWQAWILEQIDNAEFVRVRNRIKFVPKMKGTERRWHGRTWAAPETADNKTFISFSAGSHHWYC